MHILKILNYTPEQYERLVFETWFAYAEIITHSEKDLQRVLANAAYYQWFQQEHNRLEGEFIKDIQPYIGSLDTETIRDYYDEITCHVANHYSKYLLKKARKLTIINQPQLN